MLTISFHNDGTGTGNIANYDVVVRVNGKKIDFARVEGHDRATGWRGLLVDLLYPHVKPCCCKSTESEDLKP